MLKQVVNPTYAPITHPATPFGTFEAYAHLSFLSQTLFARQLSLRYLFQLASTLFTSANTLTVSTGSFTSSARASR